MARHPFAGFPRDPAKRTPAVGPCPARRQGFDAANRNKLAAVRHLQALRGGGFAEGHRNVAAFILAACLKWNREAGPEALVQVERMARACTPALPRNECLSAQKSAFKPAVRKMGYRWIATQLAISAEEAQSIGALLGKPFPAAHGVDTTAAKSTQRATERMLRRLKIQRVVEEAGATPSCRQLQARLRGIGLTASHVTVLSCGDGRNNPRAR